GERAVRMTLTDIPKRHTCALMSHRRADVASAYMVIISIDANQHSTLKKIVVVWGWTRDNDGLKGGVTTPTNREAALSTTQLTRITSALAQALSVDEVNQIGRDTGQSERLRTVTPHRLLLAIIASLASAKVESIADLLREFNHQNGVTVAYKAFYNRLARPSFLEVHVSDVRSARRAPEPPDTHPGGPDGRRAVQGHRDPGRLVVRRQRAAARCVPWPVHDDGSRRGRVARDLQWVLRRSQSRPTRTRQGSRTTGPSKAIDVERPLAARGSGVPRHQLLPGRSRTRRLVHCPPLVFPQSMGPSCVDRWQARALAQA